MLGKKLLSIMAKATGRILTRSVVAEKAVVDTRTDSWRTSVVDSDFRSRPKARLDGDSWPSVECGHCTHVPGIDQHPDLSISAMDRF